MKKTNYRPVLFGMFFCVLLQMLFPSLLGIIEVQGNTNYVWQRESRNSRASYDALIDLSDPASLAQSGLGFKIQGTTSPNRILEFNGLANDKSYRIIQSGVSRVDGITVGVETDIHITLAGINLTRPAITGLSGGDGTAFGVFGGNCTIELEHNTTNVLKTTAASFTRSNLTALTVAYSATLTLEGTGKLSAISGKNSNDESQSGAGIGSGPISPGKIIIKGGDIEAFGGTGAPGIGSGTTVSSLLGDVIILGGTIKATGGEEGAGIGTGVGGKLNDIIIKGGNITATGRSQAAGIGGGRNSSIKSIIINDGNVIALGGLNGAGIGTGCNNIGSNIVENFTITGGKIDATGGVTAPGIGAGKTGRTTAIDISGGIIKATGPLNGTGIGSVHAGTIAAINISGGNITASGTYNGIGTGQSSQIGNLNISGGDITASGVYNGVGAGTSAQITNINISGANTILDASATGAGGGGVGIGSSGSGASVAKVSISGGKRITATGISAATTATAGVGIGAGNAASIKNIEISGGTVIAKGTTNSGFQGVGIGATHTAVDEITITGGTIEATGYKNSAGIGTGSFTAANFINAINIYGGKITAQGGDGGAGIGTGSQGRVGSITIGISQQSQNSLEVIANSAGGAAGIGSTDTGVCYMIIIKGGSITATATTNGPGIGMMSSPYGCTIMIDGGVIKATGGVNAAGIGTGVSTTATKLETLEINGGDITAIGGRDGVGIGWTADNHSSSTYGKIHINGGVIKAIANNNYGVGIGMSWRSGVVAKNWGAEVHILGGTVVAMGTDSGIGSRYENGIVSTVITGGDVTGIGGRLSLGGVTTTGPGIGFLYRTNGSPLDPKLRIDKEASVKAFSMSKELISGAAGKNSSAPAIKVGLFSGTAYLMNFQIIDSQVDQSIHDIYIKTDDLLYQGPLREMTDSFYSFAYTTGGKAQTHAYRLIENGSDGSSKIGTFHEKGKTVENFTSRINNATTTELNLRLYPTIEKRLTSDVNIVKSGSVVTWQFTLKNTTANDTLKDIKLLPAFTAGGMQLVPNSVKVNGVMYLDNILQGAILGSLSGGTEITVEFQTTVTGAINQKRVLSLDFTAELCDIWNVNHFIYIKNIDANYPNQWPLGLGIWSVPKEFNFGTIDAMITPTTALLDASQYQLHTRNDGFYTRIYESSDSGSKGWSVRAELQQFEDGHSPTDVLGTGTKLEMMTYLKEVKHPNQDPEIREDPLGNRPPALTNAQVTLVPGAAPTTILSTGQGADIGIWDIMIPVDGVKLSVPLVDPSMAGTYYQAKLVWTLELAP